MGALDQADAAPKTMAEVMYGTPQGAEAANRPQPREASMAALLYPEQPTGPVFAPTPEAQNGSDARDGQEQPPPGPTQTEAQDEPPEFVVPEGLEVDTGAVTEFKALTEEFGITHDQAQRLVDLYASRQQAALEEHQAQRAVWQGEALALPEFQGPGFAEAVEVAQSGMSWFVDGQPKALEALKSALEQSGLGNHPQVVAGFHRLGKAALNGWI